MPARREPAIARIRTWHADLLLIGVTLIWGATFVVVQQAVSQLPPMLFLALRFDLATVLLVLATLPRLLRRSTWRAWGAGALVGCFLFAGYAFQTIGLFLHVPAGRAAFITGLFVVLAPLISIWWLRNPPTLAAWAGVATATLGLALLSLSGEFTVHLGELLVLLCAISFALHLVAVARYSGPHDPIVLTVAQIGVAALLNHVAAFAHGDHLPVAGISSYVWFALLLTGVGATAIAYLLQNVLQPFTTATHTALIFTMEPVFGALFGWLLAGEALGLRGYLGGALIIAGMLLAELPGHSSRAAA